jgi:hypothetical protein
MPDDAAFRTLATIVTLDVAGYPARTEADEARTTAEVVNTGTDPVWSLAAQRSRWTIDG